MQRTLLVVIAFFSIALFTKPIQACQCAEYEAPVCAVYWRADAVFVGQVTEIEPLPSRVGAESYVAVRFVLEQPFRGVSGTQVVVATSSGTICEVKFKKGSRYLVYASFDYRTRQLFTGYCSHTKSLKEAAEDLTYIRSVVQQGAGQSVSGKVIRDWYKDESGLKVRIEGNGKIFETTTDEHGRFSVSLPDAGSFKIRVFAPFAAAATSWNDVKLTTTATDALTTVEYSIKLDKNQCDFQQLNIFGIDLHATAVP